MEGKMGGACKSREMPTQIVGKPEIVGVF